MNTSCGEFRVYLYTLSRRCPEGHTSSYQHSMAYNDRHQMDCCISCGCPFSPSKEILRKDGIAARSLLYVEGQVCKDSNSWGVGSGTEVNMVADKEELHMVHKTNFIPVLNAFVGGKLRNVWLNNDAPGYAQANGNTINTGDDLQREWYCIQNPPNTPGGIYRFVTWQHPPRIRFMDRLHTCIRDCVQRAAERDPNTQRVTPRNLPTFDTTFPGCRDCNNFMTQEGTMRQLLVRRIISTTPLVDEEVIYRYNLTGNPFGPNATTAGHHARVRIDGNVHRDPAPDMASGIYFSFQATIAYYIHRCLPQAPVIPLHAPGERDLRPLYVLFAFCLLETLSLMYERYFGIQEGGERHTFGRRNKPVFRYKGMAELYISYILWYLLTNDVAEGEPQGGRHVDIEFVLFHRYWFKEMLNSIAYTHPGAAGAVEVFDVIFSNRLFNAGRDEEIVPGRGTLIRRPARIIGFMATSVTKFYLETLKPYFSRQMAGLDPLPVAANAPDDEVQKHEIQRVVYNMLLSRDDLDMLMAMCERAAPGDIDSYMNHAGVHSVMHMWMDMLVTSPDKVNRLIGEWVDTWTLHEYLNIQDFLRQNPSQPKLSEAVAESIYLMCNVLEAPTEPTNQEELEVLKAAPKCSVYKAALRLDKVGAFKEDRPVAG